MSSQGNNMSDETTFRPSEPKLCANGCGFFGTAATMDMCSKCYRDMRVKEEQAISANSAVNKHHQSPPAVTEEYENCGIGSLRIGESAPTVEAQVAGVEAVAGNRCLSCRRKVGLIGFKCKCGGVFCGTHRHPEIHSCPCSAYNKLSGQEAIARANPLIKADKLDYRC